MQREAMAFARVLPVLCVRVLTRVLLFVEAVYAEQSDMRFARDAEDDPFTVFSDIEFSASPCLVFAYISRQWICLALRRNRIQEAI